MVYLLSSLLYLCPPGHVCLEYPAGDYQLQLDQQSLGCDEHISILEAQVKLEKMRADKSKQMLAVERVDFTRRRKGMIAGMTVIGSAAIAFLAVMVEAIVGDN